MKKIVILGNILEFQRGYDLTHNEMDNGSYPVEGSTSTIGFHSKYKTENSIVIGRSGTIGRPRLILGKFWPHNTALFTTNIKKNNLYYVYYLLLNLDIARMKSGSNIPTLNRNDLYLIHVVYETEYSKQEKIVSVLRAIDYQIKRNEDMVHKLQVLALSIYNRWFIQFEHIKPSEKLIFNSELNRTIPENWTVKRIGEICNLSLGGTPKTDVNEYWNGNLNWLNSGEVANFPIVESELKITKLGLENSATKLLKSGTTVVSITGNIRASFLAIDSCANQSVVGIEENNIYKVGYIYPLINNLVAYFTKASTGNCQKHINKGAIENAYALIPPIDVMIEYNNIVNGIYEQIKKISLHNLSLIELKNKLLPLLINQQLA